MELIIKESNEEPPSSNVESMEVEKENMNGEISKQDESEPVSSNGVSMEVEEEDMNDEINKLDENLSESEHLSSNGVLLEVEKEDYYMNEEIYKQDENQSESELEYTKQGAISEALLSFGFLTVEKFLADYADQQINIGKLKSPIVDTSNQLRCDICYRSVRSQRKLKEHMERHKQSCYVCPNCNQLFYSKERLREHMRIYKPNVEISFQCQICLKYYLTKSGLSTHLNNTHSLKRTVDKISGVKGENLERYGNEENIIPFNDELNSNIVGASNRYKCNECEELFSNKKKFRKHMTVHKKQMGVLKNQYECNECHEIFSNKRMLKKHTRVHQNLACVSNEENIIPINGELNSNLVGASKKYECDECHEFFSNKKKFKKHKRMHINLASYGNVENIIPFNGELNNDIEDNSKNYECDECQETFNSEEKLGEHMKMHRLDNYNCTICEQTLIFKNKSELFNHIKIHRQNKHKCTKCDQCFRSEKKLRDHLKTHDTQTSNENKEMDIEISTGENISVNEEDLISLNDSIESNSLDSSSKYNCTICEQSFKRKKELDYHMKIHRQNKHKCSECEECFRSEQKLKDHMEIHKPDIEKLFQCDICLENYKSEDTLNAHVEKKHVYTEYSSSDELKDYSKIRRKNKRKSNPLNGDLEKPVKEILNKYESENCPKSFDEDDYDKDKLNNPQLVITEQDTNQCDICSKYYSSGHSLKIHRKIHTDEKKYQCNKCEKAFHQKNNLKNHIKSHHGIEN